jgi:hypothetical protein
MMFHIIQILNICQLPCWASANPPGSPVPSRSGSRHWVQVHSHHTWGLAESHGISWAMAVTGHALPVPNCPSPTLKLSSHPSSQSCRMRRKGAGLFGANTLDAKQCHQWIQWAAWCKLHSRHGGNVLQLWRIYQLALWMWPMGSWS